MTPRAIGMLVFLATVAAGLAHAPRAHAFYCDGHLVAVGDDAEDVRAVCGEPTRETTETITETETRDDGRGGTVMTTRTRTVTVWLYDFGPRRLVERLIIDGGVVGEIHDLGYGRS